MGKPSLLRESGLLKSGLLAAWRLPYTPNEATVPLVTRIIGHHEAANQEWIHVCEGPLCYLSVSLLDDLCSLPWSQVLPSLEDVEDAMLARLYFCGFVFRWMSVFNHSNILFSPLPVGFQR
jgi:hypothetical protein